MRTKQLFFLVASLLFFNNVKAQQDTVFYDTPQEGVNFILSNLDSSFYDGKLLERSLSGFQATYEQAHENYNQIHSGLSWLMMYSNVHYSYVDTTKTYTNDQLIHEVFDFFDTQEMADDDELIQPFGLLLHRLNHFDSTVVYGGGLVAQNGKIVSTVPQQILYKPIIIKSSALIEFYGASGYATGKIKYDERFISTSDDITLNTIRIDVGNGFEDFGPQHPILQYNRFEDSIVASVAINYSIDGNVVDDTLLFYLTTITGDNRGFQAEKGTNGSYWDDEFNYNHDDTGVKFHVGVLFGCGNSTEQARRPFIILPPYRPKSQMVSMNIYYTQFNIHGLFNFLVDMGYDVYFIKVKPGNNSLDESGVELANFLYYINEQKNDNYNNNFPGESWENVVMGLSAGGQIARYGLMYAEYQHMYYGDAHPHTKLYISFDSPHWGANIPMYAQASMHELARTGNILANFVYASMKDDASKDMAINHIISSNLTEASSHNWQIYPHETSERDAFLASMNSLTHSYTHLGDLRKSFPTFSRNVAISTGRSDKNYTDEFGLYPNMLLFVQNTPILPSTYGLSSQHRLIFASRDGISQTSFFRYDIDIFLGILPIPFFRVYSTNDLKEWDMAQGGYKDEFYDKDGYIFGGTIPISPVGVMRSSAWHLGTELYKSHMSFLPLISALAINPTIWTNNNLFYDVKDQGLMYQHRDIVNTPKSNFFGYPNLGHPADHFNITPFEAVFADSVTYEHIKMDASANPQHEEFLDSLRNFIVNEVEAKVVYFQNQVIGQNHINQPNYTYKAWYKAKNEIIMGADVTPKTDIGDYVVEKSADITVYAGQSISLEPGFSVEYGADFHAFIAYDGCSNPLMVLNNKGNQTQGKEQQTIRSTSINSLTSNSQTNTASQLQLYPNPNKGEFTVVLPNRATSGTVVVNDLYGKTLYTQTLNENRFKISLNLPQGIYFLHYMNATQVQTIQFVVQ